MRSLADRILLHSRVSVNLIYHKIQTQSPLQISNLLILQRSPTDFSVFHSVFDLNPRQHLSTADQTMEHSEAHAWNRKIITMGHPPQPSQQKDPLHS
jgi:hypothetical protein